MLAPVKTVVQDLTRLREISTVLTKYGFGALARSAGLGLSDADDGDVVAFEGEGGFLGPDPSEAAVRFRNVLQELGPTFVKLGQILSTRPDIMPAEFMEELKHLQDRVAPMEYATVKKIVEESFDQSIDRVFKTFNETPLAAASIGQVHRATLKDGTEVVVKVQRDGIRGTIQADLDILIYLARFLEATVHEFELYTPTSIVREFERAILSELDFTEEARNIDEFRDNFEEIPFATAPIVFHDLTTPTVMTLEFVDADKLSAVEGGSERSQEVLPHVLDSMVKMVMYDGFFHGDPHPGNILVREDNTLVFIDFGLIGRLSAGQQDDLILLIISVISGDVEGISRSLLKMGRPVGRVNLREFKADITRIRDEFLLSNIKDIDVSKFVTQCTDAAQYHKIKLNPNYAILVKAAATIEGIMRALDPEMDIMAIGVPYARELAKSRFTARKVMQGVITGAMGLSGFLTEIPQQLDQVLMDLEGGNLELRLRHEALDSLGRNLNTLGTRLFLGIIASGLAICAAILLEPKDIEIYGISIMMTLGISCALTALIFFWWALGWHVIGGDKPSKLRLSPIVRLLRKD